MLPDVSPQRLDATGQLPLLKRLQRALFVNHYQRDMSGPYGYSLSRIDRAHARIGRRAPDSLRGLGIEILDCIDHTIAELSIYRPRPVCTVPQLRSVQISRFKSRI